MVIRRALCASLVLLLVAGAAGAAAPRSSDRCRGHLLLADGSTRLVRTFDGEYHYFSCLGSGRRRHIADEGDRDTAGLVNVRVAGPYIAFDSGVCPRTDRPGPQCTEGVVHVVDARTGERRRHRSAPVYNSVSDLEVSRTGAVAWIRPVANRAFEVRRADARGEARLAEGADVDPRSLAISGDRLYWLQGGEPRTAVLERGP